jgi:hypothetical protein
MTESPQPNDKVTLAVGFLAILATMYAYRDSLNQIQSFSGFSLYNLLIYMSVSLFLSIYLSSLANLRHRYDTLEKSIFLTKCDSYAEILYLVAIIVLPTTFLGGYLVSGIILFLIQMFFSLPVGYKSTISFVTSVIILILVLYYLRKNIKSLISTIDYSTFVMLITLTSLALYHMGTLSVYITEIIVFVVMMSFSLYSLLFNR